MLHAFVHSSFPDGGFVLPAKLHLQVFGKSEVEHRIGGCFALLGRNIRDGTPQIAFVLWIGHLVNESHIPVRRWQCRASIRVAIRVVDSIAQLVSHRWIA